jgi:hypothetical protein
MSTQFKDTNKDHATIPQVPSQGFPQSSRPKRGRWLVIATVIFVLAVILGGSALVLAPVAQHPGGQVTPTPAPTTRPKTPAPGVTPTPGGSDMTPTPAPGVTLGPQSGPSSVKDLAYWDKIVGTKSGVNHVESVSFANIMDSPSLQALVMVRYSGPDATLDVCVYNNITSAKPTQIFKWQGLLKGDAKISGYNTIMTAEVDKYSALNANKPLSVMKQDLFREFDWSSAGGTLVQAAFPGLFPDLTRYQAEADQRLVSYGQDTWKNNAAKVAQNLAVKLLKWSPSSQVTIQSGGGARDVDAVVQVRSTAPDHPTINVTLSRLEGNTHNMWVAIAVADGSYMSITSPHKWDRLTSPVTVKGTGGAFESDVGSVYVLDHLYNDIGHAKGIPANGGKTTFTATVPYSASFHGGAQEGVLAYYTYSQADSSIAGVVMQKVLLSA